MVSAVLNRHGAVGTNRSGDDLISPSPWSLPAPPMVRTYGSSVLSLWRARLSSLRCGPAAGRPTPSESNDEPDQQQL